MLNNLAIVNVLHAGKANKEKQACFTHSQNFFLHMIFFGFFQSACACYNRIVAPK